MPCSRHTVVVLHDAVPPSAAMDEQDSLRQLAAVTAALCRLGYTVDPVAFGCDLVTVRSRIAALAPQLVFNLVESRAGQGHLIDLAPALLGELKLPFTGTPREGVFLTSHKVLAKRWLALHGCPTPAIAADPRRPADPGPWIVKSVWEDASFGLDDDAVVTDAAQLAGRIGQRRARLGGEWFAEAYVPGREFNVSLLECASGCRVLPLAEIRFPGFAPGAPQIVGYRAKWVSDSIEYRQTTRHFDGCEPGLRDELARLALRCWDIFGLRGYARVDFRVDDAGRPWILEVNVNPCLAPDAGYAAALSEAGTPFDDAIASIVAAAENGNGDIPDFSG
ncbi:MAG TPA: D-alanine--D-alanine ligase [Gammaproteobacteria bacterium]|nr:D-alanine--D-alanine ligase [Gammaproteobacteria bacterium]